MTDITLTALFLFLCFAALFAIVVYLGEGFAKSSKENFNREAHRNLTEMFIFVDVKKVYAANLVVLVITFIAVFLVTGNPVLALGAAVFLGMAPKYFWSYMRKQRETRFLKDLPDAVTSMATMMRSGATLPVAMELVVAESKGPISEEFGLFLRELTVGVEYNTALDNLAQRMPVEELNLVTSAMKISREVGGSLADVLYRLGDTIRRKIEMEGKIKALTAQGKAQGVVMTLLPVGMAVMLFYIDPEPMSYLFTSWQGWVVCFVFTVCIYLGYHFIKKIITIDV